MNRPNILFIMADQMAAPILPLHDARSPVRMPHLMKLAERAVVFDLLQQPAVRAVALQPGQRPPAVADRRL